MKLPYGISNFEALREQGYLYVDKTSYIEKLENLNSKYLFFIRPRRFGKSLFLSTLAHYYDLNQKDAFDRLYGDLYIGTHPTGLRNQYMVLKLNFSGLNTDNPKALETSMKERIYQTAKSFFVTYAKYFESTSYLSDKKEDYSDASAILLSLISAVKEVGHKLYVIIDEYDHFANDIIAMGEGDFYKEIVRASGFVRDFYETLKIGTESVVDRIFITGVSPVMLDDLTSGFNIAMNVTMKPSLNEMLGFTEDELNPVIEKLALKEQLTKVRLREYYNGYIFNHEGRTSVYNPDMILFYFTHWAEEEKGPSNLIDENVKTDYGRLQRLIQNGQNRDQLEEIIRNESITANIVSKFSFDRMYDEEYFVSLLFYMGLLTIKGQKYGQTELGIPNYVIKTIFWEYFERRLRETAGIRFQSVEVSKAVWEMAFDGEIQPFINFIQDRVLKVLSNRDLIRFDEKNMKLILLAYLNLTNIYRPVSERETDGGYMDIFLEKDFRMPDIKYEWLLELKYVKESERSQLSQVKQEGRRQLARYAEDQSWGGNPNIKKALLVFVGKNEIVIEEVT